MVLLVSILFAIQALCFCGADPPTREAPIALLSPACDDAVVEEAADAALHQINADRKEGYILRLYRIFSVRERPQENGGSLFYLILDVIDTKCHVRSKKYWKNCEARSPHSTVYGQCKAAIYINQPENIAHLTTYECTLQTVPRRYIWKLCPDCPVDDPPDDPRYSEAAFQCLAKFNEESEQTHYFSVLEVTRAAMQWMNGFQYFVEFLIQETSCSKNDTIADISQCKPLSPEPAKIGFCKGSAVNGDHEPQQFVTVSCEIYNPQDPATEDQVHQTPGESSENRQPASSSETKPFSLRLEKPVGCVKMLPPSSENISDQDPSGSQNEPKDGEPVPPKAVGCALSLGKENTEVDKIDLTKLATRQAIIPFPEELSLSDSCPGEKKEFNFIIDPLIPKKPN